MDLPCQTTEPSDKWTLGQLNPRTSGPSDNWTFGQVRGCQINMHNGLQKLNLSGKKGVKWTGRPAAKQWVSVCSHIRHCSFLAADQLAMMLHKTARSTISLDCVHENLVVTQLVSGTTTGLLSTHNMAEITKTWSGLMNWPSTPSVDISKRRRRHH